MKIVAYQKKLAFYKGMCIEQLLINFHAKQFGQLIKIDKFVQKFWYVHKLIDVFTYRKDFVQGFQPEEADSLYLFNSHRQNPLEVQE